MTRDEAFDAILKVLNELQRAGTLTYEQRLQLNERICRYGAACAKEARECRQWALRPIP